MVLPVMLARLLFIVLSVDLAGVLGVVLSAVPVVLLTATFGTGWGWLQ